MQLPRGAGKPDLSWRCATFSAKPSKGTASVISFNGHALDASQTSSGGTFRATYLRQEPYVIVPYVRNYAVGAGNSHSYPDWNGLSL